MIYQNRKHRLSPRLPCNVSLASEKFTRALPRIGSLVALSISALLAQDVAAQSWSREEIVERQQQQVLHWGQKGEHHSNNGWSDYGKLQLSLKTGEQAAFTQANGEWLVTLSPRATGRVSYQALVMPNIVLLYQGKQKPPCTAERVESLGIQAETALFFLAQAFPFGPRSASQAESREIYGPPSELRFLRGILRIREPWKVTVSVAPAQTSDMAVRFDIKTAGKPFMTGEWQGPDGVATAGDAEPLENWNRCWYETQSENAGQNKNRAAQLRSARTVGELRSLKN